MQDCINCSNHTTRLHTFQQEFHADAGPHSRRVREAAATPSQVHSCRNTLVRRDLVDPRRGEIEADGGSAEMRTAAAAVAGYTGDLR